jgi:hypothetical protein
VALEISAAGLKNKRYRNFGLKLGGTLVLVGGVFWWRNHVILPAIFWAASFALIVAAVALPHRLGPVERWWMQLGHWIGRFTTPIMTAFVFFGLLTTAGFVLRLFGANPLKARGSGSLWIAREDGGRSDLKKHF